MMSGTIPQRRLESFSAFAAYRAELAHWLDGTAVDELTLYRAGVTLCTELRAGGALPEHILMELHALGMTAARSESSPEDAASQDHRYMLAIRLLLKSCFGEEPPLRSVRGADGRQWLVLLVREGMRWDPEIEMRRKDWLSCVATDDRRYITPVPSAWTQWTDGELLAQLLRAPVDLRGPR